MVNGAVGARIGILALQGAVREHRRLFANLGADCTDIKYPSQLESIDGLVIPGGESTTIGKLMVESGLIDAVKSAARQGMPIFGTCAGLILMGRVGKPSEQQLGLLDITVRRNAYGRQTASFETDLATDLDDAPLKAIFIRAPIIEAVGPGVRVLAAHADRPVLVEERQFLGCSFHPELTGDSRIHRYFLDKVRAAKVGVDKAG